MADWSDEAAAKLLVIAYSKENARDEIANALRQIWSQGKTYGFQRGQQSVIDFHKVVSDAARKP